jgi:hypothetical protein
VKKRKSDLSVSVDVIGAPLQPTKNNPLVWDRIDRWTRSARLVASILLHSSVLTLVVVSVIEVITAIEGSIRDLAKGNKLILIGVLIATSIPSGAVLFWSCSAIKELLNLPIRIVYRHFGNRAEFESDTHTRSIDFTRENG